jgi:VIT1/CCC1 family predicted Fe2+/Mn2+ transporter
MAEIDDVRRYQQNLQDEVDSYTLYGILAEVEKQPQLSQVYAKMAEEEEHHARFWEKKLEEAGEPVPPRRPGWRTTILGWLARRLGAGFVLPTIARKERNGSASYSAQPEVKGTSMTGQEAGHERLIMTIAGKSRGGMQGGALAQLEGRHRAGGGNALRAAVLGANDGLLSNMSLVMGVAGAALSEKAILITGTAGLLAGAFSMALGEWLSVQSSRELYEHQIKIEADELAGLPQEEEQELALIYQAKGLPPEPARQLAKQIMADQSITLDTLAREELGIDPQELGGSAWEAAITSFFLFAIGAFIPLAPFIFLKASGAIFTSLGVSGLGMFLIGAAITLLTGKNALLAGLRQVLFGLAAAGITYAIGHLIGVSIGG